MTIKIGEAAHDERGALAYGKPGDQTKDEVREIELYNNPNRPWVKVFRAKDQNERKKIALAMRQAVANNHVGYAQYNDGKTKYGDRYGLFEALKDTPSHTIPDVKVDCNTDCSQLMCCCCRAAGIAVDPNVRTAIQEKVLMSTGHFDVMKYDKTVLEEGDILWLNGHTAIVTNVDNKKAYSTIPKWVGKVKQYCKVYTEPSLDSKLYAKWMHLGKDNLVDVCDEDVHFYYVRIAGKHYGFVERTFIYNLAEDNKPKVKTAKATTDVNLRTAPINLGVLNKCKVDRNDGKGIRSVLYTGETAPIVGESGNWYQLEIKGEVHTWTPWATKSAIKVVE